MNIDEEITLHCFKTDGYKRAGPQEESKPNTNRVFKCTSCTSEFQNKMQLETHSKTHSEEQFNCFKCSIQFKLEEELESQIITHKGNNYSCEECDNMFQREEELNIHARSQTRMTETPIYNCSQCKIVLQEKKDFEEHIRKEHGNVRYPDEWNCNNCAYQVNQAEDLVRHLKECGHQPSKNLENKKYFSDYKYCYTCKQEFDGYHNLMNHRSLVHPSKKNLQRLS